MQAIILAAGRGRRLGNMTQGKPKAMMDVAGRPLIDYTVAFVRSLGVSYSDTIVVGGHLYEQLRTYITSRYRNMIVVENTQSDSESLSSLRAAFPHITRTFIQCDSDFVYTWQVKKNVGQYCSGSGVEVFGTPIKYAIPNDMVKIQATQTGLVRSMAKDLSPYTHGYIGMFYCGEESIVPFKRNVEQLLNAPQGREERVWSAFPKMLSKMNIAVADIGTFDAVEVDTLDELAEAEKFIKLKKESVKRYFMV